MCLKVVLYLFALLSISHAAAVTQIDCQRPPQLVNPATCCQDGGRDLVAENCAKRMGLNDQSNTAPPTVDTATCLAECILVDSRYLQQPNELHFDTIQSDLQQKFANDSIYVETMVDAFRKCQPFALRRLQAFQQAMATLQKQQPQQQQQKPRCSHFSGIILSCTYMEYFKNCPAHRWTDNAQCALAKQFVTQCSLGA